MKVRGGGEGGEEEKGGREGGREGGGGGEEEKGGREGGREEEKGGREGGRRRRKGKGVSCEVIAEGKFHFHYPLHKAKRRVFLHALHTFMNLHVRMYVHMPM